MNGDGHQGKWKQVDILFCFNFFVLDLGGNATCDSFFLFGFVSYAFYT